MTDPDTPDTPTDTTDVIVTLRAPRAAVDRWRASAAADDRSLSSWIRVVCDAASSAVDA